MMYGDADNSEGINIFASSSTAANERPIFIDDGDRVYDHSIGYTPVPQDPLNVFVYPNCMRVVRFDKENIGPMKFLAAVFPFVLTSRFLRESGMKSTPNVPFHPLSSITLTKWQSVMARVSENISQPVTKALVVTPDPPADIIYRHYFGEPCPKLNSQRFIEEEGNHVGFRRLDHVFADAWNTLRSTNQNNPQPLRSVMKYVEATPNMTLFPDIYNTKANNGMDYMYHHNLSVYSNFLVNSMERYVEGEPVKSFMHHRNILVILYLIPCQFRGCLGYQMTFIQWGESQNSKSHAMSSYLNHGIPDAIYLQDGRSNCANSSTTGDDLKFIYKDDADTSDPMLASGPLNSAATDKTRITAGKTTRTVLALAVSGARVNTTITTLGRAVTLYSTNLIYSKLPMPTRTRCMPFYSHYENLKEHNPSVFPIHYLMSRSLVFYLNPFRHFVRILVFLSPLEQLFMIISNISAQLK